MSGVLHAWELSIHVNIKIVRLYLYVDIKIVKLLFLLSIIQYLC